MSSGHSMGSATALHGSVTVAQILHKDHIPTIEVRTYGHTHFARISVAHY